MKLKSVIHFPDTDSVEATWVEVVTPAVDVPESTAPDTTDADGNTVPGVVTPAHTIPAVEVQVRCESYGPRAMHTLEADLGADAAAYADLIATVRSNIVPYVPPPLTPADIVAAMDNLFNTTAQSKHYDNRITCALRAGYAGPFQAEGIAFATWMDGCNALAYSMLAEVQAGTRPMPANTDQALALLPPMVWPA